ncbi:MAG: arsenate reductase ArsC [Dehalococcoidales bacterium]|nr:arsenate reductase ArsC [Dehalococcoidales bacterium]
MNRILFVCVHNAGRSQMAKAFFNIFAKGKGIADSAGTAPASEVNPLVIHAMKEIGIDISMEKPKTLTIELLRKFDRVITMGCGTEKSCPASYLPTEDWELDDPAGQSPETVRRIRDEIKNRIIKLVEKL